MSSDLPSQKRKWWIPRDNFKKELFEKTKRDINHFLAVSQEGVPFHSFTHEFEDVTGSPVPYRDLGFKTVGEMLFHMDDILNIRQDNRHGTLFLYVGAWAPIEDEILHIRQLVIAQGISDKTKSLSSVGRKGLRLNTHDVPIETLLSAEKEKCASGYSRYQPQQSSERYKGFKNQNPNRFAPWRDNRVRAVSEAGEPIRSEDQPEMSLNKLSLESDEHHSLSNSGPSTMPFTFMSIPQIHVQAMK